MKPTYDKGLGTNARAAWQPTNGPHNGDNQLSGFYVGQVMDDKDDQYMGRVWVYIPEVSVTRWDTDSLPQGGTSPDRKTNTRGSYDQNMRNGWILVSPMTPFAGADDYRNASRPDGTSSINGAVNSYGMTAQARIGDFVGIMFSAGDPNSGYYIGMVPKHNRNGMVPGVPGTTAAADLSDTKNAELASQVHPAAKVPTLDAVPTSKDVKAEKKVAATDQFRNMARAGVSGDPIRGAGTSGARRESPSYVTGMKTSGWSYDSEKDNRDVNGKPFSDRVKELSSVNTVGHQFIMDDHPDHQQMRFRTSNGAQILMYDGGADPFIYIQTASGGAWIELSDSGNVSIYSQGHLNIHSEGDFNLTVDGDMRVGVAGDYDCRIGGDKAVKVTGSVQKDIGENSVENVGGEYDLRVDENTRLTYNADLDTRIGLDNINTIGGRYTNVTQGSMRLQAIGDYDLSVIGSFTQVTGDNYGIATGGDIKIVGNSMSTQVDGSVSLKSGTSFSVESGSTTSIKAGDIISLDGTFTYLQSGKSTTVSDITANPISGEYDVADFAAEAILPALKLTPTKPTEDQIISTTTPEFQESVAAIVPQHQPWVHRAGASSTLGTDGLVNPQPTMGVRARTSPSIACSRNKKASLTGNNVIDNITKLIRTGAGFDFSTVADSVIGGFEQTLGQLPVFGAGGTYTSGSKGEAPSHKSVKLSNQIETHLPDALSPSSYLKSYIKQVTPLSKVPRLDALLNNFQIGFGVELAAAKKLLPVLNITDDLFKTFSSLSNDLQKSLGIPFTDAVSALDTGINDTATWVAKTFPDVEMTQSQFDALISFVTNVGISRLESTNQKFITALNNGDMGTVQAEMYKYVYVGEEVDCALMERRRSEVAAFGQLPDNRGIIGANRQYEPTGNVIKVANFKISEEVRNAIVNATKIMASDIPDGTMFVFAAIESGFNPNAKAKTSSAAGLYQFIKSTGKQYGLSTSRDPSSNVFDPEANAHAGALFVMDNYNALKNAGLTTITATDLYLAHFLGAGNKRVGAVAFLLNLASAPNAIPIEYNPRAFRAPTLANKPIFKKNHGRDYRTYTEVYQVMLNKIERRRKYFLGMDTGGIPDPNGTINGAIKWKPAASKPSFTSSDAAAQASLNTIKSIVETAATQAGLTELGFNLGYLSKDDSEANGGARDNAHTKGIAIDIHIGNLQTSQKRTFVTKLIANGVTGLGIGTNTIHADNRVGAKVVWQFKGGFAWCADILQANGFKGA